MFDVTSSHLNDGTTTVPRRINPLFTGSLDRGIIEYKLAMLRNFQWVYCVGARELQALFHASEAELGFAS